MNKIHGDFLMANLKVIQIDDFLNVDVMYDLSVW